MATDNDEEFVGLFEDSEDFNISAATAENSSQELFSLRIAQTHDFKTNVCATGPLHPSFCHAFC
jgi:hypothetical protein